MNNETSASFPSSATHVAQMPTTNQEAVESDSNSESDNGLVNTSLTEPNNLGNVTSNPSVKPACSFFAPKLSDNSGSVSTDENTLAPGISSAAVVNNFDASTLGTNTATLKGDAISANNPMSASEILPKISEATKTSNSKESLPSSVLETGKDFLH